MPTGFLLELTLNTKPNSAAPAVALSAKTKPLSDALINQQIYVTAGDHFPCSFRDIFKHTQVTHYSGKESSSWLSTPNMKYLPQQLNFSVFYAATACGVSHRLLFEDKISDGNDKIDNELHLPNQVGAFLKFHVYFATRRILHEIGGPSLGDQIFYQKK